MRAPTAGRVLVPDRVLGETLGALKDDELGVHDAAPYRRRLQRQSNDRRQVPQRVVGRLPDRLAGRNRPIGFA